MGNKIDGAFWDNTGTKTGTAYTEEVKEAEYGIRGVGGTTVVANPTLDGTEPELIGLEVNGNKFKIPESKEYFAGNGIAISEEGVISLDIAVADQEGF